MRRRINCRTKTSASSFTAQPGGGPLAARSLKEMGYTNVANMDGGVNAWREKGYEIE